jgi:hypothetical protein
MTGFPLLQEGEENASYKYNYQPLTVVSRLMDTGTAFGIVFPLFMLMQSVLVGLGENNAQKISELQFRAKTGTALGRCFLVLLGETFAEIFDGMLAENKMQIRYRAGCLTSSYALSAIGLFIIGWTYFKKNFKGLYHDISRWLWALAAVGYFAYVLYQVIFDKDLEDPKDGCRGCREEL